MIAWFTLISGFLTDIHLIRNFFTNRNVFHVKAVVSLSGEVTHVLRFLVSLLIGLLLIGPSAPIQALTSRTAANPVTVTGMLEWREGPGVPHYAVSIYVLITGSATELKPLVGTEVTIQGVEYSGPTAFMQKAIVVDRITARSPAAAPPDNADQPVFTPVVPDPTVSIPPRGGSRISIPEPPSLVGTSHVLLFGQVIRIAEQFYIRDLLTDTASATAIVGGEVRLEDLEDEVVGMVASPDQTVNGRKLYRVLHAVVLTRDLADVVRERESLIYVPPHSEITILLRGKKLQLDQSPIMGNGRTLLNLRSIAEGLGAEIGWDPHKRTATVRLGEREVAITVGSNRVVIRAPGQPDRLLTVEIAPVIAGGRTMVPARVISEGLGLSVSWDPVAWTVAVQ